MRLGDQTIDQPVVPAICSNDEVFELQAVLAGWGVSVLPELMVRAPLTQGTLVNLMPGHSLPVALFWHCWNLNSVVLDALTHALKSAALTALSHGEVRHKTGQ